MVSKFSIYTGLSNLLIVYASSQEASTDIHLKSVPTGSPLYSIESSSTKEGINGDLMDNWFNGGLGGYDNKGFRYMAPEYADSRPLLINEGLGSVLDDDFANECLDKLEITDETVRSSFKDWQVVFSRSYDMFDRMSVASSTVAEALFDSFLIFLVANEEDYSNMFEVLTDQVMKHIPEIDDPVDLLADPSGTFVTLANFFVPDVDPKRLLDGERKLIHGISRGIGNNYILYQYMDALSIVTEGELGIRTASHSLNMSIKYLRYLDGSLSWDGSTLPFSEYLIEIIDYIEQYDSLYQQLITYSATMPSSFLNLILHLASKDEMAWGMGIISAMSFIMEDYMMNFVDAYRNNTEVHDAISKAGLSPITERIGEFIDFYFVKLNLFDLETDVLSLNGFARGMMPLMRSTYLCKKEGICYKNGLPGMGRADMDIYSSLNTFDAVQEAPGTLPGSNQYIRMTDQKGTNPIRSLNQETYKPTEQLDAYKIGSEKSDISSKYWANKEINTIVDTIYLANKEANPPVDRAIEPTDSISSIYWANKEINTIVDSIYLANKEANKILDTTKLADSISSIYWANKEINTLVNKPTESVATDSTASNSTQEHNQYEGCTDEDELEGKCLNRNKFLSTE